MPLRAAFVLGLVICSALGAASVCNFGRVPRAIPVDAVSGILDAFRSHQIVALGEGLHGNEQGHALRLALVRDPRFPALVNDIVVEFGNSRYQDVIDRFVGGDDVAYDALQRVWQDTINPNPLFDSPIYEEFFRAVREVNGPLPAARRIRVLLGGAPVEWEKVRTRDDLGRWDRRPEELIKADVVSRNRRALVIFGDGHFRRHNEWQQDADGSFWPTLTQRIERAASTRVFAIWTNTTVELERIQRDVASWPVPSLATLSGTRLGSVNFFYYAGLKSALRMEDQYDALVYLGPVSSITMSKLSPSLCRDTSYMEMRLRRMASIAPAAPDAAMLKELCAAYGGSPGGQ
jgi:hypothetical protein